MSHPQHISVVKNVTIFFSFFKFRIFKVAIALLKPTN
jgi:hypothetical protein